MFSTSPASAQIRVVNYNIADLNGDFSALTDVLAEMAYDGSRGFEVPVSVFVFQEVRESDFNTIANMMINISPPSVLYWPATFTNAGEQNFGGAQACFYNNALLDEIPSEHADIYTGAGRNADRWKFQLKNYTSLDASFYIYSAHLKADTGPANEQERVDGVTALRNNANTLPSGSHIIFAGDLNIYTNAEPAYTLLLSGGAAQMFDQLGSGAWGGSGNALKHTQSPRLPSLNGLVGGGMDDRFDFQLSNDDFLDNEGIARIIGDYRTFGNDGNHYNQSINDGNNTYFPGDVARSNLLADALYAASDHLPVIADYQIPARMNTFLQSDFGRVIQNAQAFVEVRITNTASVVAVEGADELDYSVVGTGAVMGVANGVEPALGGYYSAFFQIDTSVVGNLSGGITATTTSEGAQNNFPTRATSGVVVRHANASFSSASDLDSTTVNESYDADTGVKMIDVPIYNFGFDVNQSLLDVDAASAVSSPFAFTGGLATGIGSTPATLQFTFNTAGLANDTYETTVNITTSDENIPGETSSMIALTLSVTIGTPVDCPADLANNDNMVDVSDLFLLLANWSTNGPGADLAPPTNAVDVSDLFTLLAAWGTCP